jgi:CheY-like chemotaxis protein
MTTVLVVDDEPSVRRLVTQFLADHGFQVHTAASGSQALSISRLHPGEIDVLVSDISMPGMDGLSLARALRAFEPAMAVLLMSGCADVGQLDEDFAFLPKPFRIADLLTRVRTLVPERQNAA